MKVHFLGFPVDARFSNALEKQPPEYVALFINSDEAYLEEIYFQETRYIGKRVNHVEPLTQLELLQTHIFSLLKNLCQIMTFPKQN